MASLSESAWSRLLEAASPHMPPDVLGPIDRLHWELRYLTRLVATANSPREAEAVRDAAEPVAELLRAGRWAEAAGQAEAVERDLQEYATLARSLTVHYVGHAHMDMNWLWDWPETVQVVLKTLSTVDRLMDTFPDFRFSQSQTAVYDIVRRYAPDLFERIRERVRSGRMEITANQWVEGDKNLASDEAIIRHILYSKAFFREHWGIDAATVAIIFEPDTFGHPRSLPTIYAQAGIRWFYFCRGGPGHPVFRWRAPDGSEVIAWSDFQEWYNGFISGAEALAAASYYRETGLTTFLKVFGVGDHGGGPTRRDLERLKAMSSWPLFPTLQPAFLADHFRSLEAVREQLPVVTDELNHVFPGCYTSESDIKTMNAENEARLRDAEAFDALAELLSVPVPPAGETLRRAWETHLFTHFHDILSGSGVPATYRYALGKGQDVAATALSRMDRTLHAIADQIRLDGPAGAVPLVVFNPLAWARRAVVETDVYERFEPGTALSLTDHDGHPVPLQYRYDSYRNFPGHRRARLVFPATLPGLGWAVYWVHPRSSPLPDATPPIVVTTRAEGHSAPVLHGTDTAALGLASDPFAWPPDALPRDLLLYRHLGRSLYEQGFVVESETWRVEATAGHSGLKVTHRPSGAGARDAGRLEWVLEAPHPMTAWEIGEEVEHRPVSGTRWELEEVGPVRVVLRGESQVHHSRVTIRVAVYAALPELEWTLDLDWRDPGDPASGVPGLAIWFPSLESGTTTALFGHAGSVIARPIPSRHVPSQGWTAVAGEHSATVVYHPTRYGVSVDGTGVAVSLLRASYDPDPYAEVGHHHVRLLFGRTETRASDAWARGALEWLSPPIGVPSEPHKGTLAPTWSGLQLEPSDGYGVVTAVKPAEQGRGLIVRCRQNDGRPRTLWLSVTGDVSGATPANVLEQPTADPAPPGSPLAVTVPAYGLQTVLLSRA